MKLSNFFSGLTVGTILFLGLPYVLIEANSLFNLPNFGNLLLKPMGVILIICGGALFLYCSSLFSTIGKGTPLPTDPPEALVTSGPYAHTRNPMYISYLLIFFGEFLFLGHATLLFYFFLMIIFINYFVKHIEEPDLFRRFGQKFIDYKNSVPRFF